MRKGSDLATAEGSFALPFPSDRSVPPEWPVTTAVEAGFSADLEPRLDEAIASGAFHGVHAMVLVRGGHIVFERYLAGDDEVYGRKKQGVVFHADRLHDLRSISKSVVSLLYGIALSEGIVPPLDAAVVDTFPDYGDLASDAARRAMTVRHLLTMTTGTSWDELTVPYSDPTNSERQMNLAADSVRYVLERPMVAEPGTRWTYCGGTTEVLAALIEKGAGTDVATYARERLFVPLGIERFDWIRDYDGRPHAASGLRLRPRDLAKIGELVLRAGRWGDTPVVPAAWVADAIAGHVDAAEDGQYGYQWFVSPTATGVPVVEAAGWGGQELLVVPDQDVVFVVNAGLYGDPMAWRPAFDALETIILPTLS